VTDDLGWLGGAGDAPAEPRLLAEIHGTVDLERALGELGEPAARAGETLDDPLLGARVLVLAPGLVLAEPATEGRLAASLARHDEGLHGRYLEAPASLAEVARRAAAAGIAVSRPASGPFGREVLVLGARIGDRHVILVEPRSVPSPR
jgi:hypothetical protein